MINDDIPNRKKTEVLEGIIIPTAWNERGYFTGFSLFTFDEKEYKIDSSHGKGDEISAFIRKKIRITYRRSNEKRSVEYISTEDIFEINELNK